MALQQLNLKEQHTVIPPPFFSFAVPSSVLGAFERDGLPVGDSETPASSAERFCFVAEWEQVATGT